jgi:hypothetical protein
MCLIQEVDSNLDATVEKDGSKVDCSARSDAFRLAVEVARQKHTWGSRPEPGILELRHLDRSNQEHDLTLPKLIDTYAYFTDSPQGVLLNYVLYFCSVTMSRTSKQLADTRNRRIAAATWGTPTPSPNLLSGPGEGAIWLRNADCNVVVVRM